MQPKMSFLNILAFSFLQVFALSKTDDVRYASVLHDAENNKFHIEEGVQEGAVAWALFSNEVNETGWSYLEVHTSKFFPDEVQSFAAGMLEGHATADFILMHWKNTLSSYCTDDPEMCAKVQNFLSENEVFLITQITSNINDRYWYQISLVYTQLHGLVQGYLATELGKREPLSIFDFMLMQLLGLHDLEMALNRTSKHRVLGRGSCSALIKILPNNKDLYISHVTWSSYSEMLRIYKLYDFQLVNHSNPFFHVAAQNHSFSSYPGLLFSGDDFYALSSGLVVQETTIENYNDDLWQYITPNTVLEWARTVVANRLSHDGNEWVELFSKYNSGTYNNQWMVLDYKMFTPGQPVTPGTLWVLEQLPGTVEMADVSLQLKKDGYWASYNLPYFEEIYAMSGYPALVRKYGSFFDYHKTPRAQIFKRDQDKVVDVESMMRLMRYNDFKHDPLSKCNCTPPYSGSNAISARYDLNPASGKYPLEDLGHWEGGGTDAKLTTYKFFQYFAVYAVSGPTYDQQPVFNWSSSGKPRPLGHPDVWKFKPVMFLAKNDDDSFKNTFK